MLELFDLIEAFSLVVVTLFELLGDLTAYALP